VSRTWSREPPGWLESGGEVTVEIYSVGTLVNDLVAG
jgi:hypothetical protein